MAVALDRSDSRGEGEASVESQDSVKGNKKKTKKKKKHNTPREEPERKTGGDPRRPVGEREKRNRGGWDKKEELALVKLGTAPQSAARPTWG